MSQPTKGAETSWQPTTRLALPLKTQRSPCWSLLNKFLYAVVLRVNLKILGRQWGRTMWATIRTMACSFRSRAVPTVRCSIRRKFCHLTSITSDRLALFLLEIHRLTALKSRETPKITSYFQELRQLLIYRETKKWRHGQMWDCTVLLQIQALKRAILNSFKEAKSTMAAIQPPREPVGFS